MPVSLPPSAFEAWFVSSAHDDDPGTDRASTAQRSPLPRPRRHFMTERTTVHLLRHGEVYNPDKIL